MQLHKITRFLTELEIIIDFIAQDSFSRAVHFKSRLDTSILDLPHFPYKCRRSIKSNDENVRDLIFSGYVIPYRINTEENRIEVLSIFAENEWEIS